MSMHKNLLRAGTWTLLAILTGCASSSPVVVTKPPPTPPQTVDGTADESARKVIQSSDDQIYKSEHAMDPDSSPAPNQGIP